MKDNSLASVRPIRPILTPMLALVRSLKLGRMMRKSWDKFLYGRGTHRHPGWEGPVWSGVKVRRPKEGVPVSRLEPETW